MIQRRLVMIIMLSLVIGFIFPNVAIGQSTQSRKCWAVIVACAMEPMSSTDAYYMYHVLSYHYVFDGIYYLDVRSAHFPANTSATKNNFRRAITTWLYENSDADDLVFIFLIGHGGGYNTVEGKLMGGRNDTDGDEGAEHLINGTWEGVDECIVFEVWVYDWTSDDYYYRYSEKYWDDELKADLDYLKENNKYGTLVFIRVGCAADGTQGCFNGGLIDDISAPNRIIMTASNETYVCWADLDGDGFSEWSEAFIDALHREDTYWNYSAYQIVHTFTEVDADSDADGRVSLYEAWEHAWNHDDARLRGMETPWFDDDGDGLPTFINGSDHLDYAQGDLAKQTYLDRRPPPSDPPHTPTTSGSTQGVVVYTPYTYYANATDPNGDNVQYKFVWGDGTLNVTGWYASNTNVSMQHTWTRPGLYNVSVRARDVYEAFSNWSSPLTVNITQNDAGKGQDAGDVWLDALSINPGSYTGGLYESNPTDHNDWYKFYVKNEEGISVYLTPPATSNFDLQLYNSTGHLKAGSYKSGAQTESIIYTADSTGNWSTRIFWVSGERQYSFSVSIFPPGGDGCPTLFVWNGTAYVDYGVIDIHNPTGEDVVREVSVNEEDVGVNDYSAKFRLREGWPGLAFSESIIDKVRLYVIVNGKPYLCPLLKATHSELGSVLPQLLLSDDWRVQMLLLEIVDLTFWVPYPTDQIQGYVFVIEGCNMLKP
ncbi:MAG: PKD domain-containing protein [Candidatus Bathyarchaeota archaeon]|nr:PKD domain-containing protein [Candidatus Bathyarchaeota archaeon]